MIGNPKQLAILIHTASSGIDLTGWSDAPAEYAVPRDHYDGDEGYYLWFLHSVGALAGTVPWHDGEYHSVTTGMSYVHGTIVGGEPAAASESLDLEAIITAAAPDMAEFPDDYEAARPALFYGASEPVPVRFWANLVRTNEII
ncbi:hypothetical protein [Pseudomonas paralcaligenes]|uniref:hypothetical protein n=1 Tax=Pseudomonas paralcaligenes TaxID=2772558 RepID=UPI001C818661|nr:hypothetical protein [Pseudomonas paralcaligenes]